MTEANPLRFFEHGRVSVVGQDSSARQAIFHVCLPCCLMQAVTPLFLGPGSIDQYQITNPVAVWLPSLTDDRFRPEFTGTGANRVSKRANRVLVKKAMEVLQVFSTISPTLADPSDIVPLLPMGTYVEFRYRCDVDGTALMINKMGEIPIAGIPELCYSMAAALAQVLTGFGTGS